MPQIHDKTRDAIGKLVWCDTSQGHYDVTDVIRGMLGELYHRHHIDLFHEAVLDMGVLAKDINAAKK